MILKNIILTTILTGISQISIAQENTNHNSDYSLKLNFGYSNGQKPKGDFKGNMGNASVYGFKLGYIYNNFFCTSISIDYRPNFKYKNTATVTPSTYLEENYSRIDTTSIKINSLDLMINVYFDFGKIKNFPPFITTGAGISSNKTNNYTEYRNSIESDSSSFLTYNLAKKTNFAWKIVLGGEYNIKQNFNIDMDYQYVDLGKFVTGNTASLDGSSYQSAPLRGKLKSYELLLGDKHKL